MWFLVLLAAMSALWVALYAHAAYVEYQARRDREIEECRVEGGDPPHDPPISC